MRIHGHDGSPLAERDKVTSGAATQGATAPAADAAVKAQALTGAEAVVVSSGASEIAAQAAKDRTAHLEKVARVKAAVRDGGYRVDLDRLAHKFIDEEMAGPRR